MSDQERPAPNAPFWAVLELMGHVRTAGLVSEEERFGARLGRIDVPHGGGWVTQYFGGGSVYRITVCDEATARAVAANAGPSPVHAYELPRLARKEGEADPQFRHYDDDDDAPF